MRLLQAMAGAKHGGAEAFFERLATALHRSGIEQRVAVRSEEGRVERLRAADVDVIELPFGGALDFVTRAGLRRLVRDFKPQVVLSWMNRATRFCPKGEYVHAARLGGYYDLKYYKECDHLIGNTRGIVQYIRDGGWSADKVHYLPNFVTVPPATPISRKSLATPEDAPLALALGRLHPNKGFDVLIEAMAKLPKFHLWLAGDGTEHETLEKLAADRGVKDRVHFLGWREDIPALLAAADFFVCASRIEPLGNIIIEAWAAGVPVVSAASDGPSELITDGENGLLTPIENADALAHAMEALVADSELRLQFKATGRAAYESQFSEERVLGLYKEFFEKVMR
jgi:glycosyltransferase involved in cell wall biosynthesis